MNHFYLDIPGWSHESTQGELLNYILSHYPTDQFLRICEIGVYMGRGTALWNVQLINGQRKYEYHAIDHFKGSDNEKAPELEQVKINLKPVIKNINLIEGESLEVVKNFQDEYFDIVYIDAAHGYEFVKQDIKAWLPKVKRGGFISGDDYHHTWAGVIVAVNEIFGMNKNVISNTQWVVRKF